MDTETFIIERDRLERSLGYRRREALMIIARKDESSLVGSLVPFWLRFAASTFLPRNFAGSFWPKALMTAVPVVYGLAKRFTGGARKPASTLSTVIGFLPIVKSLIKRYN